MSTIHVHNWATGSTVPTVPGTGTQATETPKETKAEEKSPTDPYLKNHTLNPASTILPKAAFAKKATSSISVGNCDKPKITQHGPDTVDIPISNTSSSSDEADKPHEKSKKSRLENGYVAKGHTLNDDTSSSCPSSDEDKALKKLVTKSKTGSKDLQLKNGYVPKGYTLSSDGKLVKTDKEATGTRYHATEQSMSTTKENLEGGGTRKVWVRTERHVTVLIQGAKAAKTDDE